MKFLLDVNALCAALLQAHVHHIRFHTWAAALSADTRHAICAISELGFIRVAHAAHGLSLSDAVALLRQFKRSTGVDFIGELPSPEGLLPVWAQTHSTRQTAISPDSPAIMRPHSRLSTRAFVIRMPHLIP